MPRLEGYRFGRLVVNGEEQTRDVIVLPERVVTNGRLADRLRTRPGRPPSCSRGPPGALGVSAGSYGGCTRSGRGIAAPRLRRSTRVVTSLVVTSSPVGRTLRGAPWRLSTRH